MKINNLKKVIKNTGIFLIAGFALAACQSTAKVYPLKQEDVRTYSLQSVKVTLPDTAQVVWGKYNENLSLIDEGKPVTISVRDDSRVSEASSTQGFSVDTDASAVESTGPRFKKHERVMTKEEYQNATIIDPLQSAIKSNFSEFMRGNQAVHAIVNVDSVRIAKSSGVNHLKADFKLMDVATNSVILDMPDKAIAYQPAGGRGGTYYGNPLSIALALAVKAAAQAAISQAGKSSRVFKMSDLYAESVRDSMAADLKPKN